MYTHLSDQYSVFSTQVIACGPLEAPWVLEGMQRNNTILRPTIHFTDTHGYTEHIFGLCFLLGLSFMPRLHDIPGSVLYKPTAGGSYGPLDALFSYNPDVQLIAEQWDELVRVAASIRRCTAPAHVIVKRLQNSPKDRIARALTALGQLVRTTYLLRYIHDPVLRGWVQLQLNRGEHRQDLARRVFFANLGEFRNGDYLEIMNKATSLSLLSNIILVWNTLQIERIVGELRKSGVDVSDKDLGRTSPLMRRHLILNGTYTFDMVKPGG